MLKGKITQAEFDALHEEIKKLYKKEGDAFLLQLSPEDDLGALRRAKDREAQTAKDEKDRADKLQKQLEAIEGDDARKKGDIAGLERSWEKKRDDAVAAVQAKLDGAKAFIEKMLVKDKAELLATKLGGKDNAEILTPHIEKRLKAEYAEGADPKTRVLDAAGGISALTLDDLEKEFVANPKFKSIIVVSNASGGASGDKGTGNSAVPNGKKFADLSETERIEWSKSDPAGFNRAVEEHRQTKRKF
jgi:hypothetical protein